MWTMKIIWIQNYRSVSVLFILFCLGRSPQVHGEEFNIHNRYPVPRFVSVNTNITVFTGETAVLVCIVENLGARKVVWRKMTDVSPLTVGTYVYVNDDGFSVVHHRESRDWKLEISNVNYNHSGEYECQVASQDKTLRQLFYLNVLERPATQPARVKEEMTIEGPEHVDTGQSFQINCSATGSDFPPDEIDWFKDGFEIVTDFEKGVYMDKSVSIKTRTIKSTLHITKARMEDTGDYTCRSSNRLVKSTKVQVIYVPKNHEKRDQQVMSSEGKANSSQNLRLTGVVHIMSVLFFLHCKL